MIVIRNTKDCSVALLLFSFSPSFFLFEIVNVELTQASNGGAIGLDGVANIIIPANDNPYGTVFFHQSLYRIQEPLERNLLANITVRRRFVQCLFIYYYLLNIGYDFECSSPLI